MLVCKQAWLNIYFIWYRWENGVGITYIISAHILRRPSLIYLLHSSTSSSR